MRMLASEAKIDNYRLLSGQIGQREYGNITHALEVLSAAQLYIDDTAGAGVLEMRAKARRLQSEHGLDLLAVDYIQLMTGRGPLREPDARAGLDLAVAQGTGQGAERADRRAVAAVARARGAIGQAAAAVRPARIGRPRAGRRRRRS